AKSPTTSHPHARFIESTPEHRLGFQHAIPPTALQSYRFSPRNSKSNSPCRPLFPAVFQKLDFLLAPEGIGHD
ncbi:MAG: hypothetical protein ACK54R_00690, partial [Pirellulaceae bacterium]